jgi:hypothetical protein
MKIPEFLPVVFALSVIISGCSKEETETNVDPMNIYVPGQEILHAVTHSIYGTDSISYNHDQITGINRYKYSGGSPIVTMSYHFTYDSNQVKVMFSQDGREEEQYSFVFSGNELTKVLGPDNEVVASFFYNSGRLAYFLYHRNYYYRDYSLVHDDVATDSISVVYDKSQMNINELRWFGNHQNPADSFELLYTCTYTHDDKYNPYSLSMYSLARNWKGDDIISYFNRNNIVNIGTHNLSYRYNEYGYPVYSDNSTYGRTSFYYQTK